MEKVLYGTKESQKNFGELVPNRRKMFEQAPATPISMDTNVNRLAGQLHPERQQLVVTGITRLPDDAITYRLEPAIPGEKPAYFRAGQYLSVKLHIGGSSISRPYSLSSAPSDALKGFYMLTIKDTQYGFSSRFIHENWKVGTLVETSAPEGHFYYNSLRDAETVIGVAGGSGITPFLSMAKDITDGNADFRLLLLFGCKDEKSILFKDELMALEEHSQGRFKVVFVLSNEQNPKYEHGFISANLIRKYAPEAFSVFICGPQVMYNFVSAELQSMNISSKYIRRELFGQPKNVAKFANYPKEFNGKVFKLTLKTQDGDKIIPASADESLLVAIERSGAKTWACCRSGECGRCRGLVISGDVYMTPESNGLRMADRTHNVVHTCSAYPLSDVELELL